MELEARHDDKSETVTKVDLAQLITWYDEFSWTTTDERDLADRCQDYKDGAQWTAEERRVLEERGQPPTVANRIFPKINTIVGYEIRGRSDPRAFPVHPVGQQTGNPFADAMQFVNEQDADAVTDALRYVADDNEAPRLFTRVLENMVVQGKSGAMLSIEEETVEGRDGTHTEYHPRVHWTSDDRQIWDPHSRAHDFADRKFAGITTWMDIEEAKDKWSDKSDLLGDAALNGASQGTTYGANKDRPQNWYNFERRRVRINEMYWWELDADGLKTWFGATYCVVGFMEEPHKVEFVDDRGRNFCPLIQVRAFVTRRNSSYGLVAQMLSQQDAINKRESKLLHSLSVTGVTAEMSAIPDVNEYRTERAKPDGVAIVADGALGRYKENNNVDVAMGQMQLLQESKQEIDRCGPSLPGIAGDGQHGMSGVAMMRRQTLGSIELEPLFDPFRSFKRAVYEGLWYLIRQYWDYEVWRRVSDDEDKRGYRFVGLNRKMTRAQRVRELMEKGMQPQAAFGALDLQQDEVAQIAQQSQQNVQAATMAMVQAAQQSGQQLTPEQQQHMQQMQQQALQAEIMQHPLMLKPFIATNVATLRMDIVIDEVPDVTVLQQEQFEIVADMAGKGVFNPQLTPTWVAKEIIQMSQLHDKRKFMKRMDEANQPPQPDPMAEQAKQLALAGQKADVENTQADTQKKLADANMAPAKAALHQADAMHSAVLAGRESVPKMPAMAAGTKGRM